MKTRKADEFKVEAGRGFDPQSDAGAHPGWVKLEFRQGSNCPLKPGFCAPGPAALDLGNILTAFIDTPSFQRRAACIFCFQLPADELLCRMA
jgi:hypothetical protein